MTDVLCITPGLSTDRPGARKGHRSQWRPPEQNGKYMSRYTSKGVKMNGGSHKSPAQAIQKRLQMESDVKVAGLDWGGTATGDFGTSGAYSYRYRSEGSRASGFPGYWHGDPYRNFMAEPENVAALRLLNPVRLFSTLSRFLCYSEWIFLTLCYSRIGAIKAERVFLGARSGGPPRHQRLQMCS